MEQVQAKDRTVVALVFAISLGYYLSLCAKSWTWMFVSYDSGDWLASSQIWMVPQPYGSPLFILLGHLINWLPHGSNFPLAMTIGLSVIPASITTSLIYMIIRKLGYEVKYAMLGSMILLACGIFLSQATVLEEYALATMFVTLALYFYVLGKRKLVMLSLGLGAAVHIIILGISILWVVTNYREVKYWLKPTGVFIAVVAVFYSIILVLMATDTPKFIAGNLSIQGINAYLGSMGTIGGISMFDSPERLLQALSIVLLGFGICIIPFGFGIRKPWSSAIKVMLITIILCFWLYITNKDMTTWTFTIFSLPMVCVLVIIGLSKMPKWTHYAVISWIFLAMCFNVVFMNADLLTLANTENKDFYEATEQLPDSSVVICSKGGAYGLATVYVYSSRKDIIPVFLQLEEGWDNRGYTDYVDWIKDKYGISGENWEEQVGYCLRNEIKIYVPYKVLTPDWQETFDNWYGMKKYNAYWKEIVEEYDCPHIILD